MAVMYFISVLAIFPYTNIGPVETKCNITSRKQIVKLLLYTTFNAEGIIQKSYVIR